MEIIDTDELMNDFSSRLKYYVPLGLCPEEEEQEHPHDGIEVAIVFYWSYRNNLLVDSVIKVVKKLDDESKLNHDRLLFMMKSSIGRVLRSYFYHENGKDFAADYIALTNQWAYSFYKDLDALYPKIDNFSHIPQDEIEYQKIFLLLNTRFKDYSS